MEQNNNLEPDKLQNQNSGQVRVLSNAGYPVTPFKYILMSALTLNFYSFYWAYKNFTVLDPTPVKRPRVLAFCSAIFFNITFYWLLKYIEEAAARQGKEIKLNKGFLAATYFSIHFMEICVARAKMGNFTTEIVNIIGLALDIAIMMVPVSAILRLSESTEPPTPADSQFSNTNYVFMVIGGIITVLGIIGAFIPD
ncbi:MAG: hypothetical protein KIT34_05075 [Cyanobacteria bacterium TGS_CYA1]|nr:hypothetical protein [Cyanobacteria bacterium TGS_CYA1]